MKKLPRNTNIIWLLLLVGFLLFGLVKRSQAQTHLFPKNLKVYEKN
jgi:hypothetical protein